MLRRYFAAAIVLAITLVVLVAIWPQLFGLQRTAGIAQLVSFRGVVLGALAVGVLALVFFAALTPARRRFAVSIAVVLIAGIALQGIVVASRGSGNLDFETATASTVTVLAWNTLGDAPGEHAVATLALDTDADVVVLSETSAAFGVAVRDLMGASGRPMQAFTVSYDQISKARSTTLLIAESLGVYLVDPDQRTSSVLPSVVAQPANGSGPTIIGVHLVAPLPPELAHWNTDLDWMAGACVGDNVIIAGDFNSTVDHFAGLGVGEATLGECTDAAAATNNAAVGTWPTSLPPLFGAPIDHVMATNNWRFTGMRVIENYDGYGSDHRPVLAQLFPAS